MEVYVLIDCWKEDCIVFSSDNIKRKIVDYINKNTDTSDWVEEDWDFELNHLLSGNNGAFSDDKLSFMLYKKTITE